MKKLAIALTLLAVPASARPFTLLIYETPADLARRTDPTGAGKAYWAAYAAFGSALKDAGVLRGGSALMTDSAGFATVAGGAARAGGFADAPLALGGYFQIDVADPAAALDWAARLPAAATGAVVVRAGYPVPGM